MDMRLHSEGTLNETLLRRIYDPHYVHTLPSDGAPVQVCVDRRMLGSYGTGVAVYAEVLASCLEAAGASPAFLSAGTQSRTSAAAARLKRWTSALRGGVRRAATSTADASLSDAALEVSDVFREAQVFFNIHGRLLPIVCEVPPKVMHWTYPVPLYVRDAKNLYTIHDLIPLREPSLTSIAPLRHARLLQRIAEVAERYVTVSETVRAEVIAHFGCAPERVINTYQAVRAPLQRDPSLPAGLVPGAYFLFCGTVERRKNLGRLIAAHAQSGIATPLVIVGPEGLGAEDIIRDAVQSRRVLRLPWQERSILIALIRQARALCFPSLAEGFGLPIAEAMTLGAPVLTSNRGALAEIAGNAALTVDPYDTTEMSAALRQLDGDGQLRARLRAAGFLRARMFSPTAYSGRLQALYADVTQPPTG
ncbi:glycosyltransferase family 1 protein [Hyphomicrobium sp. CS1BSMeth3]|uniref:glycosyltransferase family 4 protein n=1 Tax=Hyphomicrobium sp. CS1BSMeth3 TaxID=1892844 RepID=UPI0009FA516F|nr:glycosyltransferase family 1 protein [Hyphomicrobium sp. CS1BSMeth3]